MTRSARLPVVLAVLLAMASPALMPRASAAVTREEVERAIASGVRYLLRQQRADGSWPEVEDDARTGTTSLVTLALLTAGEPVDAPHIQRSLEYLRKFDPGQLDSVYAVSLQTMVFAAASPKADIVRIQANVAWLQEAQLKPGDHCPLARLVELQGLEDPPRRQLELAVRPARPERRQRGRREGPPRGLDGSPANTGTRYQLRDGSWSYTPDAGNGSTASMTCAGISSLVISGLKRFRGAEKLVGEHGVEDCGRGGTDPNPQAGIRWMSRNFMVGQNFGAGAAVEILLPLRPRAHRPAQPASGSSATTTGTAKGAEEIVHDQDKLDGFWRGASRSSATR